MRRKDVKNPEKFLEINEFGLNYRSLRKVYISKFSYYEKYSCYKKYFHLLGLKTLIFFPNPYFFNGKNISCVKFSSYQAKDNILTANLSQTMVSKRKV